METLLGCQLTMAHDGGGDIFEIIWQGPFKSDAVQPDHLHNFVLFAKLLVTRCRNWDGAQGNAFMAKIDKCLKNPGQNSRDTMTVNGITCEIVSAHMRVLGQTALMLTLKQARAPDGPSKCEPYASHKDKVRRAKL